MLLSCPSLAWLPCLSGLLCRDDSKLLRSLQTQLTSLLKSGRAKRQREVRRVKEKALAEFSAELAKVQASTNRKLKDIQSKSRSQAKYVRAISMPLCVNRVTTSTMQVCVHKGGP